MVSFHEDPENFSGIQTVKLLDSQIQSSIDLGKRVKASDEGIAASVDYLRKTSGVHERGRGGFGEFGEDFEAVDKGPLASGPGRLM
jgi:hypothetical protein